jgi:phage gpG-like protein
MITVEIRRNVDRQLDFMANALTRRESINRRIAIELYGITMRNFAAQGNDGTPWVPFQASRVHGTWMRGRWKGKGKNRYFDPSAKLLQDTGHLRQSFLSFADDEVAGVGAASFRLGPDEPADLAAIHEFGNAARHIPARPMLPTERVALEKALVIYNLAVQRIVAGEKP